MQTNFSPSINIVRDLDKNVNYIPTLNAQRIFNQIINDYKIGIRSFNIIGSYGTGKSAFLLALEQYLKGDQTYFNEINGKFKKHKNFEFLNFVGDYTSIINTFTRHFSIEEKFDSNQHVIKKLDTYFKHSSQENNCLVIVLDEFGKFLEYASSNNSERELFFIQQLAEYANDVTKNVLFITVLHQSFDTYSRKLDKSQQQEWEKVKGRLKEIPFNEPVEQLLFLAAERIERKNFPLPKDVKLTKLLEIIKTSNVFPLDTKISTELAKKLYPFDILSASILTLALQLYGQNERSLFTFLESDDYLGLNSFVKAKEPHYNLCNVYDYLQKNYSSFLITKYNPHFFQWRAIQNAIDRVEATFEKRTIEAIKLVKSIGMLNIFTVVGAKIDKRFLTNYAKLSLGQNSAESILKDLENKKIIRFLNYKNQFILFEGTDLDIEIEIDRAASHVNPVTDVITLLRKNFDFPYLTAKAVHYKFGTPRFFQFQFSDSLVGEKPKGQVDGIINLVFSENLNIDDVILHSKNINEAIVFGLYHNTNFIKRILFEIRKINYVLENLVDDRVAERELRNILEFQKQELNQYVLNNLYHDNEEVIWVFNGQVIKIGSRSRFNNLLSEICEEIYPQTPIFNNELINRERLSSAISKARKNLLEALINRWDQADLGFGKDEFPPEKTIYLALLKKTGIHKEEVNSYILGEPTESSFKTLWEVSEAFLDSAKNTRKNLNEFVEILTSKPFKLKRGFVDFWVSIFLFIKREDFALFGEEVFIPAINLEALELVTKNPNKFRIKTFELHGVRLDLFNKYRALLNQTQNQQLSKSSFIETIKPFLVFYNDLPEYTKRTKRLSKGTWNLRESIAKATDPETTFFEDFPRALGYSTLNLNESGEALSDYILQLQRSIRELRSCFDTLINRIEKKLLKSLGYKDLAFSEYRNEIRKRFETLKIHLLLPHQIIFFRQLKSELDDRNTWIRSIAQAILSKPVEKMRDEEEELLLEKISSNIKELDNLCDISKIKVDPLKEEVIKLEVTTLSTGSKSSMLRLPVKKAKKVSKIQKKLRGELSKDRTANISALIKLLQDEISDE